MKFSRPSDLRSFDQGSPQTLWQVEGRRVRQFQELLLPALAANDGSLGRLNSKRQRTLLFVPGCRMFVKHHHPAGWFTGFRRRIQGSHAEREWNHLHALQEIGLRVPEAVAWGLRPETGESFFVCSEVSGARTLLAYLENSTSGSDREAIIESLAYQLAWAHQSGWSLPDLHGENLLVSDNGLFFIDFHSARALRTSWRIRGSEWGELLASIGHLLTTDELGMMFEVYLDLTMEQSPGRFLFRVSASETVRLRHLYRRAGRRLSPVVVATPDGGSGRVYLAPTSGLTTEHLLAGSATLDASLVISQAPRTRVTRRLIGSEQLVVKEYLDSGLKKSWRFWLRTSRAECAYRAMAGLRACHIPTPEAVACLVRKEGSDSLWTRSPEGAVPLDHLLSKSWDGLGRKQQKAVTAAVARLVGRLHRLRIFHPDLTPRNLLVQTGDPPRVWVVDLDGIRLPARLSRRARLLNLAQLQDFGGGSDPGVIRAFLQAYREESRSNWLHENLRAVAEASRHRRGE